MTHQVRAEVSVPVDPSAAFRALVDLPSQSAWMLGTQLYELAGPVRSPQVGARLAALTGVGGLGLLDVMEVTAYSAAEGRWTVRHAGRFVRGTGEFVVTPGPRPHTCMISWAEDVDLPFGLLGRIGWPLAAPLVRWGLGVSLRRLAAGLTVGRLPVRP